MHSSAGREDGMQLCQEAGGGEKGAPRFCLEQAFPQNSGCRALIGQGQGVWGGEAAPISAIRMGNEGGKPL